MLVGQNCDDLVDSEIFVDNWKVEYQDNAASGQTEIVETFCGQIRWHKQMNRNIWDLYFQVQGTIWPTLELQRKSLLE